MGLASAGGVGVDDALFGAQTQHPCFGFRIDPLLDSIAMGLVFGDVSFAVDWLYDRFCRVLGGCVDRITPLFRFVNEKT